MRNLNLEKTFFQHIFLFFNALNHIPQKFHLQLLSISSYRLNDEENHTHTGWGVSKPNQPSFSKVNFLCVCVWAAIPLSYKFGYD